MFDRHVHVLGPSSVDVQTHVTEQRAPTDESVRLLKEMEAAAREKALATVRLEGNGFNGVIHVHHDHLSCDVVLWCLYEWRGEKRRVFYRDTDRDTGTPARRIELLMGLRDELAKDIAGAVLSSAFRGIDW